MEQHEPTAGGLTLESLAVKYANVAATVGAIGETVNRLALDASSRAGSSQPAPELDGSTLVAWVTWLAERYELGSLIPGCWPLHGALVEELAALHIGWLDAIGQAGTAATLWHEHLNRALDRMDGRWRTCIDGTHRAKERPAWFATGPDGADTIDLDRDRLVETRG